MQCSCSSGVYAVRFLWCLIVRAAKTSYCFPNLPCSNTPVSLGDRREISVCVFRFSEVNLAVRIGQIMLSFDLKNPSQFRNAHASAV